MDLALPEGGVGEPGRARLRGGVGGPRARESAVLRLYVCIYIYICI